MNVSLTPELESLVHSKVSTGLYNSASEVIRDALRLLAERDQDREAKLQQLRADLQVGIDQIARGEGRPFDVEGILAEARSPPRER